MKRYAHTDGYVMLQLDSGRRVLEHRYVIEQLLGRALESFEVVHHKNKQKNDNALSNLELHTVSSHARHHSLESPAEMVSLLCVQCGCDVIRSAAKHKNNLARKSRVFCSKRCVGLSAAKEKGFAPASQEHGESMSKALKCRPRCDLCKRVIRDYQRNRRNKLGRLTNGR